ncbi:hypothetical protein D3H55_17390 [Bacillus salacetis]|uniref:Uncharacterized protein n=1 Tax=Bacillus salacetis TaxID=2315464 RepID=A0A3A1QVK3_9BACI|nr:hypothetical protein D3H55_17390 [Bacillus salacetis]
MGNPLSAVPWSWIRKKRDRNLLVVGHWSWIEPPRLACGVSPVIKSGSAPISPDRQMFQREKKAIFPFILFGLFDPEGLGAGTRRRANPAGVGYLPLRPTLFEKDYHLCWIKI